MSAFRCTLPKGPVAKNPPIPPKLILQSINVKRNFSSFEQNSKRRNLQINVPTFQQKNTLNYFVTSKNTIKFSNFSPSSILSARTFATVPPSPKPETTTATEAVANTVANPTPLVGQETVQDLTNALNQPAQHIVENLPVWETLKNSYLAWLNPANLAEAYFEAVHHYTGLPWWASIAISVLGIRTVLMPVLVKSARYSLIMKEIQPKIADLMLRTKIARQENNYPLLRQLTAELTGVYSKYGVTFFTPFKFAFIQAPIFISSFWALRRMAEQLPSFTSGGLSWFTDLSAYDPYMRLPVISALLFAASLEFGTENIRNNPNPIFARVFMYGFAATSIFFSRYFPMALHIYWCSSSLLSLIQMTIIKRSPLFKKWLYDWKELTADKLNNQPLFVQNPKKVKGAGVQAPSLLDKQLKTASKDAKESKEKK